MDRYVPLPPLPARISRLNELAYDLWWSWNAEAREVFRDLDLPLWRFTDHNPVLLLHLVESDRLEYAATDPEFLRLYDEAIAALDTVRAGTRAWWAQRAPESPASPRTMACVAPAFSLHQALPLDGDGAAVAAGDFCKEASDLGVPLVAVGLMHPRGYVHQRLSGEGWQQDAIEYLDWSDIPIAPAFAPDGSRLTFSVPLPGAGGESGQVHVEVWQVRAGRVALYLLDADVPDNAPADRELSAAFEPPGTARSQRRQALLQAGAARTLALLGIDPEVTLDAAAAIAPGVHVPGWLARDVAVLVERHLGADWRDHQDDEPWWDRMSAIPDGELWDARQRLRAYLIDFTRARARRRWTREQSGGAVLVAQGTLLDPGALTIGFASRFGGGLRPEVIFHDAERLASILTARRQPVQIIFAGRAHSGDEAARRQLQRLFTRALDPMFGGRIAFLEDYDLHAARLLVQGCDLWLSMPAADRPVPLGALKAAINGVPALVIEPQAPDAAGARAFYRRLEEDIVPAFYHRDRAGVPVDWVGRVRETIRAGVPRFSARHAVKSAAERLYNPALRDV
jgi:glucan phosphorylase